MSDKSLIKKVVKFASTSAIATLVDYILYLVLVEYFFSPVYSHIISAGCGMIINFFLQKRFVFVLRRKIQWAFIGSVLASLIGIALGSVLIHYLNFIDFFKEYQFITKLVVTGTIFFYNFFTKRFIFEASGKKSTSPNENEEVSF